MNDRRTFSALLCLFLLPAGTALAQDPHLALVCDDGVWVNGEPFPPESANAGPDPGDGTGADASTAEPPTADLGIAEDHFGHYQFQRVSVPENFLVAIAYSDHDRVKAVRTQGNDGRLEMEIRRPNHADAPHWSSLKAEGPNGAALGVQANSIFLRPDRNLLATERLGSPLQDSLENGREVTFRDQAAETLIPFDTGILLDALDQLHERCR